MPWFGFLKNEFCLGFAELLVFEIDVFQQIWELYGHYFLKYFSVPFFLSHPFRPPITHMLNGLLLSHRSVSLCSMFKILLSVLQIKSFLLIYLLVH